MFVRDSFGIHDLCQPQLDCRFIFRFEWLSVFAEIRKTIPLSTFVRGQRFQNLLNLTVVRELQSVQRAEATDRHECRSFVPIDKRMVDDDEME
jgi:hypothetical protein